MLRFEESERRRRLAVRHALAPGWGAGDPREVAQRLVALHATDPATVFLAIAARTSNVTPSDVEDALYKTRELIRMLAMRRTMFVVPSELAPVIEASTLPDIAAAQRRLLIKHLRQAGLVDRTEAWLDDVERTVLSALVGRGGTATASELSSDEPRLKTTLSMAEGKPYAAVQNITSRVLLLLGAQGRIVRGRPTGSWLSQRYEWSLKEHWLETAAPPPDAPPPEAAPGPLAVPAARRELARRWLTAFGPAPPSDLRWWTGWTMAAVSRAVADLGAVEVDLAGSAGIVLPEDVERTAEIGFWVALLPALDPTVMGWSSRDWFLGDHAQALFDRSGNAGPTAWMDGRIVGGWSQRPDGEVVVKALEDIGREGTARLESEASLLSTWLGDVRIIPRFRTPTERALSA